MARKFEDQVAEVLRRNWNPFQPGEGALFESYVRAVVTLLREHSDELRIAEYLSQAEALRLGLVDTTPKDLLSVSRKLKKLRRSGA